jgi:hypothetical protein
MKLTVGAMITLGVINAGEVGVALADDPLGLHGNGQWMATESC